MTNRALETLRLVIGDLDRVGAKWALIGGLAISARAEPRFTRDVDVCVAVPGDPDAEEIVRRLMDRRYSVLSLIEHAEVGRLATARLTPPGSDGLVLDLLFASSGIEPEIVREAERIDLMSGVVVPVAGSAHLVALKLLARDDLHRPQDAADLVALQTTLTREDAAQLRRLVRLIGDRGFNRERDLIALADDYLVAAGLADGH